MTIGMTERDLQLGCVIDWLATVVERRDLSVDSPAGEYTEDLGALLDTLSQEFLDYRAVVTGIRDAVLRNADMLRAIASAAVEQGSLTSATTDAITDAGRGVLQMADDAAVLHGLSRKTGDAVNDAAGNIDFIDGSLGELFVRLAETDRPLSTLRSATEGVADFVVTLARLSRHAQLLAVNASIEAAYLNEAGAHFAIVASELRKLSESTRKSKMDVEKIVAELRETSRKIFTSTSESQTATNDAGREITGAGEALGETAEGIDEFETIIANYEAVIDTQSMALEAIGSAIDQIAYHSQEAANASHVAEQLNLDGLLEHAHTRAGRWQLRITRIPSPLSDDGFGRWIESIRAGVDAATPADVDNVPDLRPLVASVRSVVEHVNAEQREILADVIEVAVAISRNGYAWRSISFALDGVAGAITTVREKVAQWAAAAFDSVEFARGMQTVMKNSISDHGGTAVKMLDGALALIAHTDITVRAMDGSVKLLNSVVARADDIMALIEMLNSETELLSLNAAIKAAHAGSRGLGFSVIAEEIRSLARSTSASTTGVSELVSDITAKSADFQTSIAAASKSMKHVVGYADGARGAIDAFRGAFDAATESAAGLAGIASEQERALDLVLEYMNRCASAIIEDNAGETARGRLDLAIFGSRAHAIAARRPIGTVIDRVRPFAEALCMRLEAALETAVAGGHVMLDDLFCFSYQKIDGPQIETLARLFDVSRVPPNGFAPVKYATAWDAAVDEAMIDVLTGGWEEATTSAFAPIAMAVTDLNGFVYAYPRQCIADWTNTRDSDDGGNRIKLLIEDEYAFRVGRWGLGPHVAGLGARLTYEQFRDAGCLLDRTVQRPWGAYVYARDPKLVCNEVVMGLFVRGLRHSTLRFCYDPDLL